MKKLIVLTKLLLISGIMYAQLPMPAHTDQVIIKFRSDFASNDSSKFKLKTGALDVDQVIASHGALSMRKLNTGNKIGYQAVVLKFPTGADIEKILNELSGVKEVEYAEPDFIGTGGGESGVSPNDPYYNRQWGLKNDGSFSAIPATAGVDIEMEEGWAISRVIHP